MNVMIVTTLLPAITAYKQERPVFCRASYGTLASWCVQLLVVYLSRAESSQGKTVSQESFPPSETYPSSSTPGTLVPRLSTKTRPGLMRDICPLSECKFPTRSCLLKQLWQRRSQAPNNLPREAPCGPRGSWPEGELSPVTCYQEGSHP